MMNELNLLLTLTACFAAALVLGYLTQRLRLSTIVGYLLAGIVVGPYTPGFVADRHLAEQFAEVGVILLMFGVGLHFHPRDLLAVRRIAIPGAVVQSLAAAALAAIVARGFGWNWTSGIVFGLALSVASTVVLTRVLADSGDLHTATGHVAVGWLIVEDLFTVLVLVLMPVFAAGKGRGWDELAAALLIAVVKVLLLVWIVFRPGARLVPRLLEGVAKTGSRELFTLAVLVIALGIAVGSAEVFGVSMALGAFLAGMIVGRSDFSLRAATEALPLRDAFAVLFFVSVGLLLDPRAVVGDLAFFAAALGVVLVGKPVAAIAIVVLLGKPVRMALAVAVALAQIGEFSFILTAQATALGLVPKNAVNSLVAVAIVSISLNPLLYTLVARVSRAPARLAPKRRGAANASPPFTCADDAPPRSGPVLVVGYGPIGQSVVSLLRERDISVKIIDLNLQTVQRLRAAGVGALYGDARFSNTLSAADIESAWALVLTGANEDDNEAILRSARELNPRIRIFARAYYLEQARKLREAGASAVFSAEGEIARALAEHLSQHLPLREEAQSVAPKRGLV